MKSALTYFNSRHIPEPNSGCWIWTGYLDRYGYGVYCTGSYKAKTRRHIKAHRLSYELFCGPIPEDHLVCHKCDNPCCVNPDHLFVGTWRDNVEDMMTKGRHVIGGKPHRGEKNGKAKLTAADVDFIRRSHVPHIRKGEGSTSNLAARFGVGRTAIQRIVRGQSWSSQ